MTALLTALARRRPAARVLAGLLTLLLVPAALLSACSQVREQAGNVVEHAIEEAIDGLDLTDGLPPDFPTDDVPVVDGPTRGAAKSDQDGRTTWVVLVEADDAGTDARELLLSAGLEVTHTVTTDAGVLAELAGNGVRVKLIASTSRVVYVVSPS